MSPSAISLTMIFAIVGISATIGILAGARRKMDLEQWTVGGRGFGAVLMYLLMAGETYTTFAFLGASGWAYSRGGPTLYILAYLTLAYVVAFFILPPIWETGRKYGMQTQSDFFSVRYGNKYLAGFVCIVGIASFIPVSAVAADGARAHRLDRELRWHRPNPGHGGLCRAVGRLRSCERSCGQWLGSVF
jgi:SSS family solute:Na+ symporter